MKLEEAVREAGKLSKEDGKKHTLLYDETETNFVVKSYPEYDDVFILTKSGEPLKDGFCMLTLEELVGDKWAVG